MADINELISKKALNDMIKLEKVTEKTAKNILSTFDAAKKLDTQMKKGGTKDLTDQQKVLIQNKKTVDQLNKQLITSQTKLNTVYSKTSRELTKNKLELQKKTKGLKLATTSVNSLKGSYNQLNAQMQKNIIRYRAMSKAQREGTKRGRELKKTIAEQREELKKINGTSGKFLGSLKSMVLGAFGIIALVAGLKKLIGGIIEVRKEFEKYEAVLTVALGSQREARIEMGKLQKFAAETPFQLQELTGAYVKLVNQGFKPTMDQMRLMGDLAASQGKSFDQLTEAIIDAQVGEFERLKEFGIRAQKHGDQVAFTFKEITTEVDFTADSIQNYILGLGEAEGVSGSMAAISETLGGRISNLGDAWDTLLNTLGTKTGGVFAFVIGQLSGLITMLNDASKSVEQLKQEAQDESLSESAKRDVEEFTKYRDRVAELSGETYELSRAIENFLAVDKIRLQQLKDTEGDEAQIAILENRIKAIEDYGKAVVKNEQKIAEKNKEIAIAAAEERAKIVAKGDDLIGKARKQSARDVNKEIADIDREALEEDQVIFDEKFDMLVEQGNRELEELQRQADEKKMIEQAAVDTAIMAGNAVFDFTSNMRDAELQNLQQQKERGAITEEKYAEKVAEIRRRQAIADKAQALFNIAIGTAVKVVQSPLFLAPFIIAQGAIQAAIVASKPIPQFAEGTESTPFEFIAGEAGRELMIGKSGQTSIVDKATHFKGHQYKGSKIIPNRETEEIIAAGKGKLGYDSSELKSTIEKGNAKLIKTIKNKRELTVIPSKRKITERSGHYFKNYFNAKLG